MQRLEVSGAVRHIYEVYVIRRQRVKNQPTLPLRKYSLYSLLLKGDLHNKVKVKVK
jgi:hypothetical protein